MRLKNPSFSIGEHVTFAHHADPVEKGPTGIVTGILYSTGDYIEYRVNWFHDGAVKTGWFIGPELEHALTLNEEGS